MTYTWNLKYDTNGLIRHLFLKQKQTHRHRGETCGCHGGGGGERDGLGF